MWCRGSGRSVQKCNSLWMTHFGHRTRRIGAAIAQSSTRRHVYRGIPLDTKMSFKDLLRGGSPGDPQKSRVAPERVAPADLRTARSTGARNTTVLYVGEPRETRLISGAFTYDHPQLAVDLSS